MHWPSLPRPGAAGSAINLFYLEVLDQRVGEQLLAELGQPLRPVGLQLDHAADPDVLDPIEAERRQRPLDRLALRVEDPLLGPDQDPGLQKERSVTRS
jgi:hypothetical protein